jgi:hypothetical protein
MFIDHVVMTGPNDRRAIKDLCSLRKVLAQLHPVDSGVDGIVSGPCFFCLRIPTPLGIECIDVTGPSAEPDKDTAIRLPSRLGSPKPVGTAAGSYHSHCAATMK